MGNISAILLAAGESTRMRQPKALLSWEGGTLLEYQVVSLSRAGVAEIIVVLGYQAETLAPLLAGKPQVKVVRNPRYRQGKTTSIRAGLKAMNPASATILIIGVDQPRSAATINLILEQHQKTEALVTIPIHEGRGGHPVVFSVSLLPSLLAITEEKMGLREVINRYEREVALVEVTSPEVLLDINTPPDYQRALRLLTQAGNL